MHEDEHAVEIGENLKSSAKEHRMERRPDGL
jgi:hypothetical protein